MTLALIGCLMACTEPVVSVDRLLPALITGDMEAPVRRSIETAKAAVATDPDSAAAWGELGRVLHAHERFAAARPCYEQAIRLDPKDFRWPWLAANAVMMMDQAESLPYFETALRLAPNNQAILIAYARVLTQLGQTEAADGIYRRALTLQPESGFALIGLARLALIAGSLAEARELLEQARGIDTRAHDVYVLLAQVYLRMGETALAAKAEQQARIYGKHHQPGDEVMASMEGVAVNAAALANRGRQLAADGDLAAAEFWLRQVIDQRGGNARDHGTLASVLARQGKFVPAFEHFNEALRQNPEDVVALGHMGLALLQQGQRVQATDALASAVALDPDYAEGQFNLGVVHYSAGRYPEAIAQFERTIALDPGFVDAYINLGSTFAAMGHLTAALAAWQRLDRLQDDNPLLLYNIGVAEVRLGQHREAIAAFTRGLDLAPDDHRLTAALARELVVVPDPALRDPQRALVIAKRLVAVLPQDREALELMAAILVQNDRLDDAISYLERLHALAGGDAVRQRDIERRLDQVRRRQSDR